MLPPDMVSTASYVMCLGEQAAVYLPGTSANYEQSRFDSAEFAVACEPLLRSSRASPKSTQDDMESA